jgi:hypothetical protein
LVCCARKNLATLLQGPAGTGSNGNAGPISSDTGLAIDPAAETYKKQIEVLGAELSFSKTIFEAHFSFDKTIFEVDYSFGAKTFYHLAENIIASCIYMVKE